MLELFVNTLTADGKYSLGNRDNLMQHIQMEISKKEESFSDFFFFFAFFRLNSEHFEKKYYPHSLYISEDRNCERCA